MTDPNASKKWDCPNGCGRLQKKSPIDARHHCLVCGGSWASSEIINALGIDLAELSMDEVGEALEGLSTDEALQQILILLDQFGARLPHSWLKAKAKALNAIVAEAEGRLGKKLPKIVQLNLITAIFGYGDEDDDDRRREPEPDPQTPKEKELV